MSPVGSTRERYLRLAVEMAREPTPSDVTVPWAVSAASLADIAAEVGLTRTALYRLWPSRLDFWRDLIASVGTYDMYLQESDQPGFVPAVSTEDWEATRWGTREALNEVWRRLLGDPWVPLHAALSAYPDDPYVSRVVSVVVDFALGRAGYLHDCFNADAHRVTAPPLTARDIGLVYYAAGLALPPAAHLLDIGDIVRDGRRAEPWSVYAHLITEVCFALSIPSGPRPRPGAPADPVDLTGSWSAEQRRVLTVARRHFRELLKAPARPASRGARGGAGAGPIGHVTLASLASRAGVSRQALRAHWPSQHELELDVLEVLWRDYSAELRSSVRAALRVGFTQTRESPWLGTMEQLCRLHLSAAATVQHAHLAFTTHYSSSLDRLELARREMQATIGACAADLEALMRAAGLRLREGVTAEHLAMYLVLLPPAFGRIERTNPGWARLDVPWRGGRWSAPAAVLATLFEVDTVPS